MKRVINYDEEENVINYDDSSLMRRKMYVSVRVLVINACKNKICFPL